MVKNEKIKLFMIAYHFPPIASAESLVTMRLLRNITKKGIELDVLTTKYSKYYRQEKDLLDFIDKDVKIHNMSNVEIPKVLVGILYKIMPQILLMPDHYLMWYLINYNHCRELVKQLKPQIIYTRSQPFSSILFGLSLKKEFNIPWVAHFSDPLVDNIFYYNSLFNYHKPINKLLEKKCVMSADQIHFVSCETKQLAQERYGTELSEKFKLIPHCYDTAFVKPNSSKTSNNSRIKIVYTGSFTGSRNPNNLFEAIRMSLPRLQLLNIFYQFIFVGPVQKKYIEEAADLIKINHVKMVGSKTYKETNEIIYEADLLLLIDGNFDDNIYFPSKLVEYLGTGKPIIGITPPKGTTYRILNKYGHFTAKPGSVVEISQLLLKIPEIIQKEFNVPLEYSVEHVQGLFLEEIYKLKEAKSVQNEII